MASFKIRAFQPADWPALWALLHRTFQTGDTYAYAPDSSEADIHRAWIELPAATWVACLDDGRLAGTYCLKANQPGLGAHVCNCGYVVAPEQQGLGIATALCEHSQQEGMALGFSAMQFNLVVSTNERALRLWRRLGFAVVGTLPQAFRHRTLGLVDAFVMHKRLQPPAVETAGGANAASLSSQPPEPPKALSLTGLRVRLRALQASDAEALVAAASDGELWNLPFTVVPSAQTVHDYIAAALDGCAAGTVLAFVTELVATNEVIGSTRFWKIDRRNRKLEIGSTWLGARWQRSFVNTEAKLLMLEYAFEQLRCVRVQFTTDETNAKSRAAILRLGARQEGIVRHERIMPDGRKRNSVRFSIIDAEWPAVRAALVQRLADR